MKAKEFDRISTKLELKTRKGRDLLAWFEYEGRTITRTKRSMGSGDVPMQHSIRQQLKLNEEQLRGILECSLSRPDYVEILRSKGLL